MSREKPEITEMLRRETDLFQLNSRIGVVEKEAKTMGEQLTEHVQECASNQKKVLLGVIGLLLWTITHSPEAVRLFGAIFP